MKFNFSIGKAKIFASVGVVFPRVEYARGFTNRCEDGRYVLFIDYDNVPLDWIEEEIKYLGNKYLLGDVHLFKTGNGFHAVSTIKMGLNYYLKVLKESSVDPAYYYVPLRVKRLWTLRTSEKDGHKPKYVKTIHTSECLANKHSKPHSKALKALYGIPIPQNVDDFDKLISGHYYEKMV